MLLVHVFEALQQSLNVDLHLLLNAYVSPTLTLQLLQEQLVLTWGRG